MSDENQGPPSEDGLDPVWLEALRESHNAPPEPPREAMWAAIRRELPSEERSRLDLVDRRRLQQGRLRWQGWMGWSIAAAALLVLGVGLGRMTAPTVSDGAREVAVRADGPAPLRTAAGRHLEGTETFLTLVRDDARSGGLGPEVQALARGLLVQTRLFLDAAPEEDAEMVRIMEDLELVLAQLVSVDGTQAEGRTELDLALRGMAERDVLPRIRNWSSGRAGT